MMVVVGGWWLVVGGCWLGDITEVGKMWRTRGTSENELRNYEHDPVLDDLPGRIICVLAFQSDNFPQTNQCLHEKSISILKNIPSCIIAKRLGPGSIILSGSIILQDR